MFINIFHKLNNIYDCFNWSTSLVQGLTYLYYIVKNIYLYIALVCFVIFCLIILIYSCIIINSFINKNPKINYSFWIFLDLLQFKGIILNLYIYYAYSAYKVFINSYWFIIIYCIQIIYFLWYKFIYFWILKSFFIAEYYFFFCKKKYIGLFYILYLKLTQIFII